VRRHAKAATAGSTQHRAKDPGPRLLTGIGAALLLALVLGVSLANAAGPTPLATTAFAAPRTTTTARLNAYVNPEGAETTYYFQYGLKDCSANPCTSVPASEDAVAGSDLENHLVSQEVEGLSPGTTYHYRVIAESVGGTAEGQDKTFSTRTVAEMTLPPRGIEMVNPPDKGVQNVRPVKLEDQNAITGDGEHAAWTVGGGAPGGTTGAQNSFLATRTSSGWMSESLVPSPDQQVGEGNLRFNFVAAASDLSHFIFMGEEGLFSSPDTAFVRFDRNNHQDLLTTLLGVNPETAASAFDTTSDTSHALFVFEMHLYDYGSGTPEEVGLMPNGEPPLCGIPGNNEGQQGFYEGGYGYHWIATTDASRVFFRTRGDNCGDPFGLYVRNRDSETTTQIATEGLLLRATPDGRAAVFSAAKAKLTPEDTNTHNDLYRWEEGSPIRCLTCFVPDAQVSSESNNPKVSKDLSRVYFSSPKVLIPGEGKAGSRNLYILRDDGSLGFIGVGGVFGEAGLSNIHSSLTPDGRVLLIHSDQGLLTTDSTPEGEIQLYRYDDGDGSVECVSCRAGAQTKLHFDFEKSVALSADGSTAAFTTAEALLPSDVNRSRDIYEWRNGVQRLITDGVTTYPEGFAAPEVQGSDASGDNIVFTVAARMTGFEHDGLASLYDARVGGGFEVPNPPVHCDGDSCQGLLEPPPAPVSLGSAAGASRGNVANPRRRHHRKRHKVRHHKRNRHANSARKHG
jgi:hypothetical protein